MERKVSYEQLDRPQTAGRCTLTFPGGWTALCYIGEDRLTEWQRLAFRGYATIGKVSSTTAPDIWHVVGVLRAEMPPRPESPVD
jgi:hypothetical protein